MPVWAQAQHSSPSFLLAAPVRTEYQPHSCATSNALCSPGEVIADLLHGAQSHDAAKILVQDIS